MIVLGIDPGTTGCIAAVCSQRGLLEVSRVPTVNRSNDGKRSVNFVCASSLLAMLRQWSHNHRFAVDHVQACMERVGAYPGLSSFASLQMGHAAGIIEAIVTAAVARPEMVQPQEWKALYGLKKDKTQSVELVREIFGSQIPRQFGHDKAEAVLIARYWIVKQQ